MIVLDGVGWAGAAGLLLAHGLLSTGRLPATGRAYVALNLAGSAGLAVNGAAHQAWPSTALNLLWLTVGVAALRTGRARAPDPDRSRSPT